MADPTPPSDISTIEADITKLQSLWSAATKQYETQKAALAARIDTYVAAHQSAADAHSAEVTAANVVKATIVPVVAAAETGLQDVEQFVFSQPWYSKVVAWVTKQKRWLLWGLGVIALYGLYRFL